MSDPNEVGFVQVEDEDSTPEGMAVATYVGQAVDRSQIGGILRPVARPEEVLEAQEQTRDMIATILKEGRDYMTIPGTKKPSLLKSGAERANAAYGCMPRFEIIEKEIDHDRLNQYVKREWEWHPEIRGKKVWSEEAGESLGLYRYVILCELVHRASGLVIGSGVGSCSTMESKYIDRPRDLENTILKISKKRAYLDATLTAFGLSEQFTQDTEDMPRGSFGNGYDTSTDSKDWSLDSPAIGKKHKGKSWREVCHFDPAFIGWAIGRQDNFEGVDSLSKDQRKALSDELDRLAEGKVKDAQDEQAEDSGSPPPSEHSKEEIEGFLNTLSVTGPDTGKHKEKSWLDAYNADPEYLGRSLTHKWGEKFRANAELYEALKWAVGGGIERLKLEGQPEGESAAIRAFVEMTSGVTATEIDVFAKMHPELPDNPNRWDECHYLLAIETFRKVEAKGGASYAIGKAVEAQERTVEGSEGESEGITDELIAKGEEAYQKASSVDVYLKPFDDQLRDALEADDAVAYAAIVDEIRSAYFRKAAGKKP